MTSLRFSACAGMAIALAIVGTTFGCSSSQPATPTQLSKASVPSGQGGTLSATAAHEQVGAAALQEVAAARNATAKYHDVEQALADGYVQASPFIPGEGIHYVKASLIDCTFDAEHPEALLYVPSGEGLRLVGVEYAVRNTCTATPPEGFTGDADEWEGPNAEGRPIWALVAWLWLGNPNGVFAEPPHPNIN
jgi:hypothetical protein